MSRDVAISGPLLIVFTIVCINPDPGFKIQTIRKGRSPRTTPTDRKSPHVVNHLREDCFMVERTSAFIIALSIELIISKSPRPRIVIKLAKRFILGFYDPPDDFFTKPID